MATRARIGIENADGSILSSYHHWDGYPAGLGFNLISHWDDPEVLLQAIRLGDASSWGKRIGDKVDFDDRAACEGQNVYYGRDRGESNVDAKSFPDFAAFVDGFDCAGEEFAYCLRRDGTWSMIDRYAGNTVTHDAEDDIIIARADAIRSYRNRLAA